jgi:pimeloyl-ACP methyl ester carboxylesterase
MPIEFAISFYRIMPASIHRPTMRSFVHVLPLVAVIFATAFARCDAAENIARITHPESGATLNSPEDVVRWKKIRSAAKYRLLVGSKPNSGNLYRSRLLHKNSTRASVRNIPRNGRDVWVTLRTRNQRGYWHSSSRLYRTPLWNTLIEAKTLTDLPASLMRFIGEDAGLSRFAPLIRYDVRFVRIRYQTTYKGKRVTASGLLSYPLNSPPGYPVIVAQNGLILGNRQAPSAFSISFAKPETSRFVGYEFLATAGYLVIFPDWIGFGDSSEILFPMYNYEYSAAASIDMMKAVFEWIETRDIPSGEKLFLAGYSMGGYTANCLLHALETTQPFGPGKPVSATALGAGGYDLVSVLGSSLTGDSTTRPEQVSMLLASYNTTNAWRRPLTDFFQEPHASAIPRLLNGRFDTDQINARLPADLSSLLNPGFVKKLLDGREPQLIKALAANSIHNWSPASPVRLYHSRNDERIPFSDSKATFQNMINGGSKKVRLIELPGDNHYNSVFGFMELVIPWFESLR